VIRGSAFAGKTYAVLGLARSGLATVDALLASGAAVVAWDSNEAARAKLLEAVSGSDGVPHPNPSPEGEGLAEPDRHLKPLPFRGGVGVGQSAGILSLADPLATDLTGFAAVIVSPGVPLNKHPIAAHARTYGVPVIGDIELFAQARPDLPPHKVVGITGTNGKSTTTALIRHIIETAGVPVLMGGNIGLPIMGRDPLPAGGVYVLELSSYQIDLTFSLDCDVAVLTNITPDHLDRYDGFAGYAASKERLFAMQSSGRVAVIAVEDDPSRAIAAHVPDVVAVRSTDIADQSRWPALQGPHNAQNAALAIAVARALGLAEAAIEQGLATYSSLPHRMERIAERNGVLFINDSKATNATATAPALAAYPAVHWILGGLPKSDDLDDCAPHFDHVRAAYTIGTAGPMFARILRDAGKAVTESGTLAQAVKDAASAAKPGEVVMLSPACASFDQFSDYEARGDAFRIAVEGLGLC
jgi:UDP-N-acetylmuramoylalanine--D-glutamate ligase